MLTRIRLLSSACLWDGTSKSKLIRSRLTFFINADDLPPDSPCSFQIEFIFDGVISNQEHRERVQSAADRLLHELSEAIEDYRKRLATSSSVSQGVIGPVSMQSLSRARLAVARFGILDPTLYAKLESRLKILLSRKSEEIQRAIDGYSDAIQVMHDPSVNGLDITFRSPSSADGMVPLDYLNRVEAQLQDDKENRVLWARTWADRSPGTELVMSVSIEYFMCYSDESKVSLQIAVPRRKLLDAPDGPSRERAFVEALPSLIQTFSEMYGDTISEAHLAYYGHLLKSVSLKLVAGSIRAVVMSDFSLPLALQYIVKQMQYFHPPALKLMEDGVTKLREIRCKGVEDGDVFSEVPASFPSAALDTFTAAMPGPTPSGQIQAIKRPWLGLGNLDPGLIQAVYKFASDYAFLHRAVCKQFAQALSEKRLNVFCCRKHGHTENLLLEKGSHIISLHTLLCFLENSRQCSYKEHLAVLDLSSCRMGPSAAAKLGQVLPELIILCRLQLRDNNLGADGCSSICEGLQSCKELARLGLSSNQVGPKAHISFKHAHYWIFQIVELDMGDNCLGDQGLKMLIETVLSSPLKAPLQLERLCLRMNSLSADCAEELSLLLASCLRIARIDLAFNSFGNIGISKIIRAIQNPENIKIADFRFNGLQREFGAELRSFAMLVLSRWAKKSRPWNSLENRIHVCAVPIVARRCGAECLRGFVSVLRKTPDLSCRLLGPAEIALQELLGFEYEKKRADNESQATFTSQKLSERTTNEKKDSIVCEKRMSCQEHMSPKNHLLGSNEGGDGIFDLYSERSGLSILMDDNTNAVMLCSKTLQKPEEAFLNSSCTQSSKCAESDDDQITVEVRPLKQRSKIAEECYNPISPSIDSTRASDPPWLRSSAVLDSDVIADHPADSEHCPVSSHETEVCEKITHAATFVAKSKRWLTKGDVHVGKQVLRFTADNARHRLFGVVIGWLQSDKPHSSKTARRKNRKRWLIQLDLERARRECGRALPDLEDLEELTEREVVDARATFGMRDGLRVTRAASLLPFREEEEGKLFWRTLEQPVSDGVLVLWRGGLQEVLPMPRSAASLPANITVAGHEDLWHDVSLRDFMKIHRPFPFKDCLPIFAEKEKVLHRESSDLQPDVAAKRDVHISSDGLIACGQLKDSPSEAPETNSAVGKAPAARKGWIENRHQRLNAEADSVGADSKSACAGYPSEVNSQLLRDKTIQRSKPSFQVSPLTKRARADRVDCPRLETRAVALPETAHVNELRQARVDTGQRVSREFSATEAVNGDSSNEITDSRQTAAADQRAPAQCRLPLAPAGHRRGPVLGRFFDPIPQRSSGPTSAPAVQCPGRDMTVGPVASGVSPASPDPGLHGTETERAVKRPRGAGLASAVAQQPLPRDAERIEAAMSRDTRTWEGSNDSAGDGAPSDPCHGRQSESLGLCADTTCSHEAAAQGKAARERGGRRAAVRRRTRETQGRGCWL